MERVRPIVTMSQEKKNAFDAIRDMFDTDINFDVKAAGQAFLTRVRRQAQANAVCGGKVDE